MELQSADPERWSDERLLSAVAHGDGKAFAVFYRRHIASVLGYLVRSGADRETAADLCAEVFAAVLLSAHRYRPAGPSALSWVLGIARHKLLMSLRRGRVEARARRKLSFEPLELDDGDLEAIERLADEGAMGLSQLVAALPDDERDAVRLRVVEERGYREIASELRCSELVVRKRVSRGLARLRDQLTET
jgi:RNA polymerase sigma-70 factor (ECF subfamily)